MSGFVVWMTGLSGAGKSTLATRLTQELALRGVHVECLDGDEVRKNLSHGLGFSREDRDRNVRRIGYVARMVARSGSCAITAAISPYRALRDEIRSKTENFFEVYCECPLDVLTERDPKGLYKRALAGELKNFTGVDDPYEAPEHPEVRLRTDLLSIEESLEQIIAALKQKGLLEHPGNGSSLLPPPFGGEVFEGRILREEEFDKVSAEVALSPELAVQVQAVAAGYFSPVSGFMTEREAVKVKKSQALERGTPWWGEPFVLPLGASESAVAALPEGAKLALTYEGKRLAIVALDGIWRNEGRAYASGQIEGVTSRDGCAPTAREFRRAVLAAGARTVGSLFAEGAPTTQAILQTKTACSLLDAVLLAVPPGQRVAWQAVAPANLTLIELPTPFPFANERARLVVQKSVGASANRLLEEV